MDEPRDFDDILVPTDGSKAARNGAEQAIKFARRNDATLHVLYAMDMGDADYVAVPSDIAQTRRRLEKKVKRSSRRSRTSPLTPGSPATHGGQGEHARRGHLEYVDEHDIDLVVMGKRGRSDPDKPLIGSITNRVVGSLDIPVFTA